MNLLVAFFFLAGGVLGLSLGYAAGLSEAMLEQRKKRRAIVQAIVAERQRKQQLPDTLRRRLLGDEPMPRFMTPPPPPLPLHVAEAWTRRMNIRKILRSGSPDPRVCL